jgi:pyruvate/2-oxoglutarate dehydrogenase complex dihydrolipoamide acyltransferase (E2) component
MQGTVVKVAAVGDVVAAKADVVVLESMKMEHAVEAPAPAVVVAVHVGEGDVVAKGDLLAVLDEAAATAEAADDVREGVGGARRSGRTSPGCGPVTRWAWTPPDPRRWLGGGPPGSAPPARTWTTSSIRAPTSSTAPWPSPPSDDVARWRS